jgi:hypothetical protein
MLCFEVIAQEQTTSKADSITIVVKLDSLNHQKCIIPEILWKTYCLGPHKNLKIEIKAQHNSKSSLDVTLDVGKDTSLNKYAIFKGSICGLVDWHDYSNVFISKGRFFIEPCLENQGKSIEIQSGGLSFDYISGEGLIYRSGIGIIRMFGKTYKLFVDEWDYAVIKDDLDEYLKYVKRNPLGKHVQEAKTKIEVFDWENAINKDSVEIYRRYVKNYPNGIHFKEAVSKVDMGDWNKALQGKNIEAYWMYVKNNPKGMHLQEAISKIEEQCLRDNWYFEYKRFVNEFPNYKNIIKIKSILNSYKKMKFSTDVNLTLGKLTEIYHWDKNFHVSNLDNNSGVLSGNYGQTMYGCFTFGNLIFDKANVIFDNSAVTLTIKKGTELIYK